jgi:two-component system sensor histidine kinase and response regulator WspE
MAEKVICIIDDNDDIRDIYRMKFKNEGFETVLASNGLDGLELIRTHHPGVVLLDIEMPKMNGIEVLQHIKADPSIQDIPVIILSNVDSADIFQQVSDLGGAEYYMVKALVPFDKVIDTAVEVMSEHKNQEGTPTE